MSKKSGYTLIEILITLGIIGILAAILIPTLQNAMPGRDKAFVRKCYFTTKNTIYYLLNNPSLYATDDKLKASTAAEFATNFKSYLKTHDSLTSTAAHFATTTDGVDWYYSGTGWSNTTSFDNVILFFDVNGAANSPNCTQYSSKPTSYTKCFESTKPDTYAIGVRYDGKLSIFPTVQTYMDGILSDSTNIKRE